MLTTLFEQTTADIRSNFNIIQYVWTNIQEFNNRTFFIASKGLIPSNTKCDAVVVILRITENLTHWGFRCVKERTGSAGYFWRAGPQRVPLSHFHLVYHSTLRHLRFLVMERPIEENYTFYKDRGVNVSSSVTEGLCEVIYLTSSMKMMSLTSSHISSPAFFTPIKKHKNSKLELSILQLWK